jgi:hypothetical protein
MIAKVRVGFWRSSPAATGSSWHVATGSALLHALWQLLHLGHTRTKLEGPGALLSDPISLCMKWCMSSSSLHQQH